MAILNDNFERICVLNLANKRDWKERLDRYLKFEMAESGKGVTRAKAYIGGLPHPTSWKIGNAGTGAPHFPMIPRIERTAYRI